MTGSASEEQTKANLERCQNAVEKRGIQVRGSKTKYMRLNEKENRGTILPHNGEVNLCIFRSRAKRSGDREGKVMKRGLAAFWWIERRVGNYKQNKKKRIISKQKWKDIKTL